MKAFFAILFLLCSALFAVEPLPEIPDGPLSKATAYRILERRWRIIEPVIFSAEGAQYIGTEVRFESSTVSVGKPVIVRTNAGTAARVFNIPKADMDLVRQFRKLPTKVIVEGTITAIDSATRTISIKGGEIRPTK